MCDESLIGKVISEGDVEIDVESYADFYKGELIDGSDAPHIDLIDNFSSANIIGEEACSAAIRCAIIGENAVKFVDGVPFAQAFRLK